MDNLEKELEEIRLELEGRGKKVREAEEAAEAEWAARRKRIESAVDQGVAFVFVAMIAFVLSPFILFWECLREKTFETVVTVALLALASFGWSSYRVKPEDAAHVYRSAFSMGPGEEVRCEVVTRFEARCWSADHGVMRCRAAWDGPFCGR